MFHDVLVMIRSWTDLDSITGPSSFLWALLCRLAWPNDRILKTQSHDPLMTHLNANQVSCHQGPISWNVLIRQVVSSLRSATSTSAGTTAIDPYAPLCKLHVPSMLPSGRAYRLWSIRIVLHAVLSQYFSWHEPKVPAQCLFFYLQFESAIRIYIL
jgi:hypothetical protein